MTINVSAAVDLAIEVIHDAHEEILNLNKKAAQDACYHSSFTYLHNDFKENCKYCALEACNLRSCKQCGKEL